MRSANPSSLALLASPINLQALALTLLALGCGGGGPEPAKSPAPDNNTAPEIDERKRAIDAAKVRPELFSATVYDPLGQSYTCAAPKPDAQCVGTEANHDFEESCRVGGFQIRRCGCDSFCTGNIADRASKPFYDVAGGARPCAKPESDCSPPPPTTAFQDACNDKGFRLQICGCEWLCSGKPGP